MLGLARGPPLVGSRPYSPSSSKGRRLGGGLSSDGSAIYLVGFPQIAVTPDFVANGLATRQIPLMFGTLNVKFPRCVRPTLGRWVVLDVA